MSLIQALFPNSPPPNLLRQEIASSQLFISVLVKSIFKNSSPPLPPALPDPIPVETGPIVRKYVLAKPTKVAPPVPLAPPVSDPEDEANLAQEANKKLLKMFEKVLGNCAKLQSLNGEAVDSDAHRALSLKAPIVAKVS